MASTTNGEANPVAQEKINTNIITLTRFLTEEQTKVKEATGDFTCVIFPSNLDTEKLIDAP
jgi:fructose-1,6-bisphosphatase I